jgi:hypothetical protein
VVLASVARRRRNVLPPVGVGSCVRRLVALLAVAAGPAHAHHPAPTTAPTGTWARGELGVTTFALEGHSGRYETLSLAGNWRLPIPVSVGARVPFHLLHVDGDGAEAGIGDVGLLAAVELHEALAALVAVELPTGDDERGLGGGHAELAAGLTFEVIRGHWLAGGSAGYVHALGGHDDEGVHRHTFIDPHDERQLELSALVARDAGGWHAGAGLSAEIALVDGAGAPRFVAQLRGGLTRGALRWTLSAAAALNDDRPYDVRLLLAAEWRAGE